MGMLCVMFTRTVCTVPVCVYLVVCTKIGKCKCMGIYARDFQLAPYRHYGLYNMYTTDDRIYALYNALVDSH